MVGVPVTFHDLEGTDPEYYKSLNSLLEYSLEDIGMTEMTFSTESHAFGEVTVVDLVEGGRDKFVTDDNKLEYIHLLANHRMTASIRPQIDAFLEGFYSLVPKQLISLFDAQELELLISGLPEVDVEDMRANTTYHNYEISDTPIRHFWSVLKGFSKEEKALFLQFVTGSSKVPLDGFASLKGSEGIQKMSIHKAFNTNLLPTAHTCFNQLDLPPYETEEELRNKLKVAIHYGEVGFGFA